MDCVVASLLAMTDGAIAPQYASLASASSLVCTSSRLCLDLAEQQRKILALLRGQTRQDLLLLAQQARDQFLVQRPCPCGSGAGGIRGGRPRFRRVRSIAASSAPVTARLMVDLCGAGAMRRCIARCRHRCGSRASPARAIPECPVRNAPDIRPTARSSTSAASRFRRNGTNVEEIEPSLLRHALRRAHGATDRGSRRDVPSPETLLAKMRSNLS